MSDSVIEMPEYKLYDDGENRGIETKDVTLIVHGMDEDYWDVEATSGEIEYQIKGSPTETPYGWIIHNVSVWVDRRTPWDFDDIGLPVAKAQAGDELAKAIKAAVNEYHTHEAPLA